MALRLSARFLFGAELKQTATQREKTPPGFENVVQALKDKGTVDNPWAIAWAMHNKGYQPKKENGQPYDPMALLRRLHHECGTKEAMALSALGQLSRKGVKDVRYRPKPVSFNITPKPKHHRTKHEAVVREDWVTIDGHHLFIDKSGKQKSPKEMTAGEINRHLDKLDKHSSKNTTDFIKAGRGNERPSEYMSKTDPLSMRARQITDAQYALRNEISNRYGPGAPRRLPTHRESRESRHLIIAPSVSWFTPLREAQRPDGEQANGTPRICLITAGPGNHKDGNFYPPEVLQRDSKNFEGVKCFLDHPGVLDEQNRPEREVGSIGGWFANVAPTQLDGTIGLVADFRYLAELSGDLTDGGKKSKGLIESAIQYQREYPQSDKVLVGFSINAEGPGEPMPTEQMIQRWPEFRNTLQARDQWNVVQGIESVTSTDLVTFPARGGRVLGMREAQALMASRRWRTQFAAVMQRDEWRTRFVSRLVA